MAVPPQQPAARRLRPRGAPAPALSPTPAAERSPGSDLFAGDVFRFGASPFLPGVCPVEDDYGHTRLMAREPAALGLVGEVYAGDDDADGQPLIVVRQDRPWQLLRLTFTVRDAAGRTLGFIRLCPHRGWVIKALLSVRQWLRITVLDAARCPVLVGEPSLDALLLVSWTLRAPSGETLGSCGRSSPVLISYRLDLSRDPNCTVDRRLAVALGVVLQLLP